MASAALLRKGKEMHESGLLAKLASRHPSTDVLDQPVKAINKVLDQRVENEKIEKVLGQKMKGSRGMRENGVAAVALFKVCL